MVEKSIFQKMFIKPGMKIVVLNLPEELTPLYSTINPDIIRVEVPEKNLDVIQLFVYNQSDLETQLISYEPYLKKDGSFWICYPKQTSTLKSDIHRDTIWKFTGNYQIKPVALIAINDTWSALRLKREL